MRPSPPAAHFTRDDSTGNELLTIIESYGDSTISDDAVLSSLFFSLGLSVAIGVLFCFLRPYNSVVYAPRAKHADSKHAPPPVSKGFFAWIAPVVRTKEAEMVEKVGLDAVVFMRVMRMMRYIFSILTVFGCGILIPINIISYKNNAYGGWSVFMQATPLSITAGSKDFWAYVVVAYIFNIVIYTFLWFNYRAILRLRRAYFDSPDYQRSLHSRTLLLTDIPKSLRTDEGIVRITDGVQATEEMPRAAIARNVKDLPELVDQHTEAVKQLEQHLTKYLKNPDRLPEKRPLCKPSRQDKSYTRGQKVDAIDYLTSRIRELELIIKEVRESVDTRNALSYGFASYQSIPAAHSVAYAARKKGPDGTIISLTPRPNDLVWKNLRMSKKQRGWQNFINGVWIVLLTLSFTVPNILISVFLANLNNLAALWPAFKTQLEENPKTWALVQGILAPSLTTLIYFFLPAVFRRLAIKAGDTTKTSRDRHVTRSLYSFFVFNNLVVFSLFSSVAAIIVDLVRGESVSAPLTKIVGALCNLSPYWISWLLQRNLGAAVDLSMAVTLVWGSFSRRFLSPTPRERIALTAPQPFDYSGYYNYFLYYATIAVCFAPIQPLVLPVTAFYFWLDSFLKKYLILYVFITKYESAGMFWRLIFNRLLFLTFAGNVVVAFLIAAQANYEWNWQMLAAMVPLPFLTLGFKWVCASRYDDKIRYYQIGSNRLAIDNEFLAVDGDVKKAHKKSDKVGVRFGNPVLYKALITPMVAAKSQHLLKEIYSGRMSAEDGHASGYSDVYLDHMDARQPGKSQGSSGPFEFVNENQMDFEHFKNRPEFRDEAGGNGALFGHAQDLLVRPNTPGASSISSFTRTGTMESGFTYKHGYHNSSATSSLYDGAGTHSRGDSGNSNTVYGRSRSGSRGSDATRVASGAFGVDYPRGYHQTPSLARDHSPEPRLPSVAYADATPYDSSENLVHAAAHMGRSTPTGGGGAPLPAAQLSSSSLLHQHHHQPSSSFSTMRTAVYTGLPSSNPSPAGTPAEDQEDTSYDYFRRGRTGGR